jgi:GntR family transcriptional regulator, transcriptional repressor for pyruvate dehydrogenase complex
MAASAPVSPRVTQANRLPILGSKHTSNPNLAMRKPQVLKPTKSNKPLHSGGTKSLISVRIADYIEKEIADGRYLVGQRLPSQAMLCSRFKASVTAVREALRQLNARGLIHTSRGAGSFLAERSLLPLQHSLLHYARLASSVHDYSELMELRLMLETTCVQKVAVHASPALLGVLQRCLSAMAKSPRKSSIFSKADTDFHVAIVAAAENSLVKTIHEALQPMMLHFMLRTYRTPEQFKRNYREHHRIYQAILAGDAARAGSEMIAHLTYGKRNNEALLSLDADTA